MTSIEQKVQNTFGTRLIPSNLAKSELMPFFAVEPSTIDHSDSLQMTTKPIIGDQPGIGHSTLAHMIERNFLVGKNGDSRLAVTLEAWKFKHEEALVDSLATKLLFDIVIRPSNKLDSVAGLLAGVFANSVSGLDYIINSGFRNGSQGIAMDLFPYLTYHPNPANRGDVKKSAILSQARSTRPSISSLESVLEATQKLYELNYYNDPTPVVIVDASGENSSSDVARAEDILGQLGLSAKFIGPAERMHGIDTSNTIHITSDQDFLLSITAQGLREGSRGKFKSLRAISEITIRGAKLAPEEILIERMVEKTNLSPSVLICAINQLLINAVKANEIKITKNNLDLVTNSIN